MDFWTSEWPKLEQNLAGWMVKHAGFTDEADRAAVLASVKVSLLKLQKRKPNKTPDQLRAYGWNAAMNQINQRRRERVALKKMRGLLAPQGPVACSQQIAPPASSSDSTPLDHPERYLLRAAALVHVIFRAQGKLVREVTVYGGDDSDINENTPKGIYKKVEYVLRSIRTAPQSKHYRTLAQKAFERLLALALRSSRVEYGPADLELEDLSDSEAMELGTLDDDGDVSERTPFSCTAQDCATLLHFLFPKIMLSDAMDHAVKVEREIYGGPNNSPDYLRYCVELKRSIDDQVQRRADIRDRLEALWRTREGDFFLMLAEDDVPALYLGLHDGCASVGLPHADLLPDNVALVPRGELQLREAGFKPLPDGPPFYCLDQDVSSLEELNALFSETCDLARQAYGIDPLDYEVLEVEVERYEN